MTTIFIYSFNKYLLNLCLRCWHLWDTKYMKPIRIQCPAEAVRASAFMQDMVNKQLWQWNDGSTRCVTKEIARDAVSETSAPWRSDITADLKNKKTHLTNSGNSIPETGNNTLKGPELGKTRESPGNRKKARVTGDVPADLQTSPSMLNRISSRHAHLQIFVFPSGRETQFFSFGSCIMMPEILLFNTSPPWPCWLAFSVWSEMCPLDG